MTPTCPNCHAPMTDYREFDEWEWHSDAPFRCDGHLIEPLPFPQASRDCALNRTKSCGYFSERELANGS